MNRRPPTLSDVARRAGVSYATADRVVNGRAGVSEKAARKVHAAIKGLGYIRNVAAANLSQQRLYRFAIVLPSGSNAFFQRMQVLFAEAAARLLADRISLLIESVEAFDPKALTTRMTALAEERLDGVALVASDDEQTAAGIAALRAREIPVVTLVSDLPGSQRDAYVGIDNVVAGRTVGRLIRMAHGGRRGRVLPVVGALSARDHAERLTGMREVLGGDFDFAPVLEGRDRHELVQKLIGDALADDPEITAIYSAGAGNAGLVRLLDSLPSQATRPYVFLHELVPHSRRALEEGRIDVIIDQRPEEEVARVVEHLKLLADRRALVRTDPIVPTIFLRENLPQAQADALEAAG
ncbi:LacI family DNA-binding transcriptional regulator [Pseudooceanicola sp. HF7]|uniref:LacI family DNA-binding transcriptional regulator n=1 Tax=Pseudooceanicola sp. HF7 TaxID=2721560 RepID=UPI00142FA154|nr:LacI family DNA-binding transcriptional regulator [Pseudooceanicola sp. HF7]NIZ11522.1 substrate-binding domain-containing protein [Pseudooceanicola sp. HF7]